MKTVLTISGMSCAHCQKHVTEALKALPGVTIADVSSGIAQVTHEGAIPEAVFREAIDDAGYELVSVGLHA